MSVSPVSARGPLWLGGLASVVLLAGLVVWAAQVPVEGAVFAPGEVDATTIAHPIQHSEGGIVSAVAVREGQTVEAGALLLRLDGSALENEARLVASQRIEAEARARRLRAERDDASFPVLPTGADARTRTANENERRLFEARAETLSRQLQQLEQRRLQTLVEIAGLDDQAAALDIEAALIEADLTRQQALRDQGLARAAAADGAARESARMQGARAEIVIRRAALRDQIAQIALQAETLRAARREEAATQLALIGSQLLELTARQTALADRIARLELRAPVSGRVLSLAVTTAGAILRPGETVAVIMPPPRSATITLFLRPIDIDLIYPGQQAMLRIPAVASQGVPDLPGQVDTVSAAALSDPQTGARYFRVSVSLSQGAEAMLQDHALVPGMAVQGSFHTGSRTPLEYLFDPVAEPLRRALSEP